MIMLILFRLLLKIEEFYGGLFEKHICFLFELQKLFLVEVF